MCHLNVDIRSSWNLRRPEFLLLPISLITVLLPNRIKANKPFSEEVLKKLWTNSKLLALKQVNTYIAFKMYIKRIFLGLVTRKDEHAC